MGKTCLSIRYIRGKFFEHSSATIGASFLMKTLTCGNVVNTMKIWDTAGMYKSLCDNIQARMHFCQ